MCVCLANWSVWPFLSDKRRKLFTSFVCKFRSHTFRILWNDEICLALTVIWPRVECEETSSSQAIYVIRHFCHISPSALWLGIVKKFTRVLCHKYAHNSIDNNNNSSNGKEYHTKSIAKHTLNQYEFIPVNLKQCKDHGRCALEATLIFAYWKVHKYLWIKKDRMRAIQRSLRWGGWVAWVGSSQTSAWIKCKIFDYVKWKGISIFVSKRIELPEIKRSTKNNYAERIRAPTISLREAFDSYTNSSSNGTDSIHNSVELIKCFISFGTPTPFHFERMEKQNAIAFVYISTGK